MKKEFNNYRNAIAWIDVNAFGTSHYEILKYELSFNFDTTGSYFVYTIVTDYIN